MILTQLLLLLVKMMINFVQKPAFRKTYKRLQPKEKEIVDDAIQTIIQNPKIGQLKKGDLLGLSVYKFKLNKQEKLLAYTFSKRQILLISLGTHENFYRDLKKTMH
jgi:mRNA-degrading endonuclease RelE of RelBE toxin-antitoxin system